MNIDIRLSVDFFEHPKTLKLERRLGVAAVHCLMKLWCFAAKNRVDGVLNSMDAEDIDLAARFVGDPSIVIDRTQPSSVFVSTLVELRWLDIADDGVTYVLHDWSEHNSWAATANDRSDSSRLSRLAGVNKDLWTALVRRGCAGLTREQYATMSKLKHLCPDDILSKFGDSLTLIETPLNPSPAPITDITPPSVPVTKEKTKDAVVDLPEWLPVVEWNSFVDMRKKIKKPITERARVLLFKKLDAFRSAGHNISEILDKSVINNWQDVFLPKGEDHAKSKPCGVDSKHSRFFERSM